MRSRFQVPLGATLAVKDGQEVKRDDLLFTWDPYTNPIITDVQGKVRFVVLDSETTGLDPRKDRIVTIGAIAVVNHEILIEDSFEALLKVAYNSSAVTVHGVTREESASPATGSLTLHQQEQEELLTRAFAKL